MAGRDRPLGTGRADLSLPRHRHLRGEEKIFFENRSGLNLATRYSCGCDQAFFARETLLNFAVTTIGNITMFENHQPLERHADPDAAEAGAPR